MKHRGLTPLFQNLQKSCKEAKNETSGSDPIVSKRAKKPAKRPKMKHRGLTPLFQNWQKNLQSGQK